MAEQRREQSSLLDAAEFEIRALIKEKAEINRQQELLAQKEQGIDDQIAVVSRTISNLALVYNRPDVATRVLEFLNEKYEGDSASLAPGITESVRKAMEFRYPNWLPPTVVRDYVQMRGGEINSDNPMAVIHQSLRRLVDQGKAEVHTTDNGKVYRQKRATNSPGKIENTTSVTMTSNFDSKAPPQITTEVRGTKKK